MPPVEQGHQEAFQAPGVAIDYQGDPNFVYGKTASATAKPFSGIVLHHTGTESLEKSVSTGKVVDPVRKGAFGYHFYIGKDGEIVQGAPLSKRTNHVQPKNASGLKNNELLGIALVGTGEEPTRAQLDSLMALGVPLSRQFGIKPDKIFGHAQIQSDKGPKDLGEGVSTAKALREALAAPIVADDKADTSPAKDQRLSGLQQVAPVSDPATLPDIARLHGAFTDTIAKTASVTEPERRLGVPNADSDPSRYIPRIPPDLERAVAATTSPQAIDARWQGQVSMDLTFRDARGNAVQRRHMLTVSEPRIPGSGGSDLTGGRFSWNDTVTVPSFT
jgi:hypothetical protein